MTATMTATMSDAEFAIGELREKQLFAEWECLCEITETAQQVQTDKYIAYARLKSANDAERATREINRRVAEALSEATP